MKKESLSTNDATKLLERAQQAVNQGDVVSMLSNLFASKFVDGITRRLQSEWGASLPSAVINDCIAFSIDSAIEAVTGGRQIRNLGAWLWKAACNIAADTWRNDYAKRVPIVDNIATSDSDSYETDSEKRERQEAAESQRREAIRIARSLLPQVGRGQVRDVMELLIEAAEQRTPDLPPSFIADSLGISDNAARALVSRGLSRMRRLAEEHGFVVRKHIENLTGYPNDNEVLNDEQ